MADEIRTCGDLDERFAAYIDGEDTPVQHRAVADHLTACPACAEAAQAETVARDLVREHRAALAVRAPELLRARCARLSASEVRSAAPSSATVVELRPSVLRSV